MKEGVKIEVLIERIERLEKLIKATFSYKLKDKNKPDWWNNIIINIGDLSWEEASWLEKGIKLIIKHELTNELNTFWDYEKGREEVDKAQAIINLLGRIQYAKQYAYAQTVGKDKFRM